MAYLAWDHELDTKIPVIDNQHRRIVEYINELHDAVSTGDRNLVGEVLEQLVDYTLSHFAFEEELMEQSGYGFISAHRKVHQMFTRKIADFQHRVKTSGASCSPRCVPGWSTTSSVMMPTMRKSSAIPWTWEHPERAVY